MGRILSYCIPMQDRLGDLRLTLPTNLDQNRQFEESVEFVIANFGGDVELTDHVNQHFAREIASGYLRLRKVPRLDPWYMGQARNVFRGHIEGQLYSGLDADNFVSTEETRQILELHGTHGCKMLIHHFSGNWGDGTCGRVTLPSALYCSVGYDERALPRQFDEMDLILSTLRAAPDLTYVSNFPGGALKRSKATANFLRDEGIKVRNMVVADLRNAKPLDPKKKGYTDDGGLMAAMQRFNSASSFARNAVNADNKERYLFDAMEAANAAVDAQGPAEVLRCFLSGDDRRAVPVLEDDKVPVFACVQDDKFVLEEWYRHYRQIGCGPFFIVDDGSAVPVAMTLPYDDVYTLTPKVGNYRTCKGAWMKAAMKAFLPQGRWAVTVDADEFVDIPAALGNRMAEVAEAAAAAGWSWISGVLVDMLPAASDATAPNAPERERFLRHFDRHLFDGRGDSSAYHSNKSIRWGFRLHWRASYCLDVRYRLADTVDVLRKIPLVTYRHDIRIHQGLHDIGYADAPTISPDQWRSRTLLPVRHYKLVKLFDEQERGRMAKQAGHHFARDAKTTANLRRLSAQDQSDVWEALQSLHTVEYDANLFSDPDFFLKAPGMQTTRSGLLRRAFQALLGKAD